MQESISCIVSGRISGTKGNAMICWMGPFSARPISRWPNRLLMFSMPTLGSHSSSSMALSLGEPRPDRTRPGESRRAASSGVELIVAAGRARVQMGMPGNGLRQRLLSAVSNRDRSCCSAGDDSVARQPEMVRELSEQILDAADLPQGALDRV